MTYSSKRVFIDKAKGFPLTPAYADLPDGTPFALLNECEVCREDRNYSTDRKCLGCQSPINPRRCYLPETPDLMSPEYVDFINSRENSVICHACIGSTKTRCQHVNPESAKFCLNCDADLSVYGLSYSEAVSGPKQNYIPETSEYSETQTSSVSKGNFSNYDSSYKHSKPHYSFDFNQFDIPSWLIPSSLAAILVALVSFLLWYFIFKTVPVAVKVLGFNYTRYIIVEQNNPKTFNGWQDEAPIEASTGITTFTQERKTGTKPKVIGKKPGKVPEKHKVSTGFKLVDVPVPDKKVPYICGNIGNKATATKSTCYNYIPQPPKKENQEQFEWQTKMVDGLVDDTIDEPVYRTYVTINYFKWEEVDRLTSKGTTNIPVCPPTPILQSINRRYGKCEGINTVNLRILSPKEQADKFPAPFLNVSNIDFSDYNIGDEFDGNINKIGGVSLLKRIKSGK